MKREEILNEIKRFFDAEELVCPHTYAKWGEKSWQFLDTDYLHCLLIIRRDILKAPMYCNGSTYHQRGLRCNRCQLVSEKQEVYLSSHILGKAGDFVCPSLGDNSAEKARQLISASSSLLPCPIRMEAGVSWLHLDVMPQFGVNDKVYLFRG